MTLLEAREARWFGPLSVALVVGIPLVLLTVTLTNLARWFEAAAATNATVGQLARIEARIRSEAGRPMPTPGDLSALYLTAVTGSLARAELQQRLVGLVERAGGRLIEVRGDEAPNASAKDTIQLRLSLDIGNDGLFDLLSAMETGLPLLTIEALNLRPAPGRTSGGEDANPVLRVALSIRGYRHEGKR